MAAARERRAFLLADLDVLHHGLSCCLADRRPHLSVRVEAVADAQRFTRATNASTKLLVDLLVHHDAARRRAALAGRAEAAPHAALHRELEVRVVHHHDDVLAAHLEVDLLERRRGVSRTRSGRRRSNR